MMGGRWVVLAMGVSRWMQMIQLEHGWRSSYPLKPPSPSATTSVHFTGCSQMLNATTEGRKGAPSCFPWA